MWNVIELSVCLVEGDKVPIEHVGGGDSEASMDLSEVDELAFKPFKSRGGIDAADLCEARVNEASGTMALPITIDITILDGRPHI